MPRTYAELHYPGADSVSLMIEGYERPLPMRRCGRDVWRRRLPRPVHSLHGRAYHFEVRRGEDVRGVPDPQAERIERREQGVVSLWVDTSYPWRQRRFYPPPMRDLVIYEAHLPALTRHESAAVASERYRGTYLGAQTDAILSHLQGLGVGVEFLPLHASDHLLGQDWGYFSTSFAAITGRYAVDPLAANRELKSLIDAMHGRGIPVLLDVVFNHGAEVLARAWGEENVYRRNPDGHFCHGSGCGPTVRTESPQVRRAMISALERLVRNYRIDGFRFDLGALHDIDTLREIDARLPPHVYLIAEPWALGGMMWGKGDMCHRLADTRWAIWNDDYREPARALVTGTGDFRTRDRLMTAIKGSLACDGGWACRPQQSINYLTSHDGATLSDLVGGDKQRVFLGALLLLTSQGVPMLAEGTELLHSKMGETNSYNRPDLNQIDWRGLERHQDLVTAIARLAGLRRRMPHFRYERPMRQRHGTGDGWDIDWLYPTGFPHHDNVHALGYVVRPPKSSWWSSRRAQEVLVLLNGSASQAEFRLPDGAWSVIADGQRIVVEDTGRERLAPARDSYVVHAGTGVLLKRC